VAAKLPEFEAAAGNETNNDKFNAVGSAVVAVQCLDASHLGTKRRELVCKLLNLQKFKVLLQMLRNSIFLCIRPQMAIFSAVLSCLL